MDGPLPTNQYIFSVKVRINSMKKNLSTGYIVLLCIYTQVSLTLLDFIPFLLDSLLSYKFEQTTSSRSLLKHFTVPSQCRYWRVYVSFFMRLVNRCFWMLRFGPRRCRNFVLTSCGIVEVLVEVVAVDTPVAALNNGPGPSSDGVTFVILVVSTCVVIQGRLKLLVGRAGMSSPNACTGMSSVICTYLIESTDGKKEPIFFCSQSKSVFKWRFFKRSIVFCSRIL